MIMVAEMIFAVAQSTFTLAAVSELERGVGLIGRTTSGAFVLGLLCFGSDVSISLDTPTFGSNALDNFRTKEK